MTANITNELSGLTKVSSLMNIDIFWDIIEKANSKSNDTKAFNKNLRTELSLLDLKSLIEFNQRYFDISRDITTYEVRDAHLEINGGDQIEPTILFHMWIINKGKNAYELALKTPDKLVGIGNYIPYDMELMKVTEVSEKIFKRRTNENMGRYIDYGVKPKKH